MENKILDNLRQLYDSARETVELLSTHDQRMEEGEQVRRDLRSAVEDLEMKVHELRLSASLARLRSTMRAYAARDVSDRCGSYFGR